MDIKLSVKIFIGLAAIFMIPLLFIMLLPSLVFGTDGLDTASVDTLNDTSLIMENIAATESCIEEILREKHNALLEEILAKAEALGSDCEYNITDAFAEQIIYESTLIISQFCASQDDYKEINLTKLKRLLRDHTDDIFSYSTTITSREKTDEETGETYTIYHYEYIVEYAGDEYFSDHVFFLTEEQASFADEYASNLHLFLFNTVYHVETNPDLLPGETGNTAVDLALSKLGTPYSMEHRNEEGYFDCSSFTYWVYSQLGIHMLYDGINTASAQGRYIVENNLAVAFEDLAPGDLIFYSFGTNNRFMNIGHVGIYAGNGYIVDASSSRQEIAYRPVYSKNSIVLCGRPYTE